MNLSSEQKKFAYGKYFFNNKIQSILDFMDPVSKMDVKIEEVKSSSGWVEFLILVIAIIAVILTYIFRASIADFLNISVELYTTTVIPVIIGVFVVFFVIYGYIYWSHINRDVDNDLNNFIIPFLKQISKYIDKDTSIRLTTNLSSKLNKKNMVPAGTYADTLILPWFSGQFPFNNGINVFVNLSYVIDCFGKLSSVRSGKDFKELNIKAEFKFVFPKKPSFKKFDYIGANYIMDWVETEKEYSLTIKTVEKCSVEFYREADRNLGLIFDNNFCSDLIDEVYAKITGFTGYLLFKNEENATDNEDDTIEESDYNALEELKEDNRKFYEKEALEYSDVEIEEEETEKIPPTSVDKKQES